MHYHVLDIDFDIPGVDILSSHLTINTTLLPHKCGSDKIYTTTHKIIRQKLVITILEYCLVSCIEIY